MANIPLPWNVYLALQEKQEGIDGSKIKFSKAVLGVTFTVTQAYSAVPGGAMAQIGTWEASITTTVPSKLFIFATMSTFYVNIGCELITGYKLNNETAVPVSYNSFSATLSPRQQLTWFDVTNEVAAGTHTVKMMASRISQNGSIVVASTFGPILIVAAVPV